MPKPKWEIEFDEGHNTDNISDPAHDTKWVKAFIRTQLEGMVGEIPGVIFDSQGGAETVTLKHQLRAKYGLGKEQE